MSNRAQRRAAEREALKALRKQQRQNPATVQPPAAQPALTPEQALAWQELLDEVAANPIDEDAIREKERLNQNRQDALESHDPDRIAEAFRQLQEGPKSIYRKANPSPESKTSTMHTNQTKTNNSAQNATKHGCCSESILIMKGEFRADYDSLEAFWLADYKPHTGGERQLVIEFVENSWFEKRAQRTLAKVEAGLMEKSDNPLDWSEADQKTLARFQRYLTARQNAVHKARKAIEDYRRNRHMEVIRSEKHIMAIRKFENKEITAEECLQKMEKKMAEGQNLIDLMNFAEQQYGNL